MISMNEHHIVEEIKWDNSDHKIYIYEISSEDYSFEIINRFSNAEFMSMDKHGTLVFSEYYG